MYMTNEDERVRSKRKTQGQDSCHKKDLHELSTLKKFTNSEGETDRAKRVPNISISFYLLQYQIESNVAVFAQTVSPSTNSFPIRTFS